MLDGKFDYVKLTYHGQTLEGYFVEWNTLMDCTSPTCYTPFEYGLFKLGIDIAGEQTYGFDATWLLRDRNKDLEALNELWGDIIMERQEAYYETIAPIREK